MICCIKPSLNLFWSGGDLLAPFILVIISIIGYFIILNSKVENKGLIIFEKVISSLISALLISLYFAQLGYTPVENREIGVPYSSFEELFGIYLTFFLPVYLVYGTVLSYFIDYKSAKLEIHNLFLTYVVKLIGYALGGILSVGVLLILISTSTSMLNIDNPFSILASLATGIVPSLLLYHVSLLVNLF